MREHLYVDTSAYLCVLLGEDGASAIEARLAGGRLCSSVLLALEARRNLVRCVRGGELSASRLDDLLQRVHQDLEAFTLKDLTMDLCDDPAMPAVATPRSLDLAHLRTALWFHRRDPLDGYLTRDDAQRAAARELGLPAA
ncbi:MAG: type II toxin-antitoxin system VapC family toxin [Planctomycetes bacterium]|nr:type II toxin-antitoxin system VapC family toxin [Planctomycetota bacterium]